MAAVALNRKDKGDLAELAVAADLMHRGHRVAFPYGEDWDYDLILARDDRLERVQVKYGRSNGSTLEVRCRSHSLTNGKVRITKRYTAETVDWLAVYDAATAACYYLPATELGDGRSVLTLRLSPTSNGQRAGVRLASDYAHI
jgi:hypothetical protein